MTNVQARLIAASLALIAGAILFVAASPNQGPVKDGFLFGAIVLFIVEYVRIQLPPPGQPTAPA